MVTKFSLQLGISKVIITIISLFFSDLCQAQFKYYFDKVGKTCSSDVAYYYRQNTEGDQFRSYYFNGGSKFFEGRMSKASNENENENVYLGECIWYHKNGNNRLKRNFDDKGLEQGTTTYYHESGKIWKEIKFKDGVQERSNWVEIDEDGTKSEIFVEEFEDNFNDWDLYDASKSASEMDDGELWIQSKTEAGASRYISIGKNSDQYILEAIVDSRELQNNQKFGILYDFKDWENYSYFLLAGDYLHVGIIFEGVFVEKADGMYISSAVVKGENKLKLLANGDKIIFSVNGSSQFSADQYSSKGSKVGFALSGIGKMYIEALTYKNLEYAGASNANDIEDANVKSTGSGVIVSANGIIVTNHHVIEDAKNLIVEVVSGDSKGNFKAKVLASDPQNDLAVIQITDPEFKPFAILHYDTRLTGTQDVGSTVFTLGYPLALAGMGKEVKFSDGKVSSKTGYNAAINSYQVSVPVQPGNSGGPLFNESGQLVGIINAKIQEGDNVSYAIKISYLLNLIDTMNEPFILPADKSLSEAKLEDKIKVLSNYVVLIKAK